MVGVPVLLREGEQDYCFADEDAPPRRGGRHALVDEQIRVVQRLYLLGNQAPAPSAANLKGKFT